MKKLNHLVLTGLLITTSVSAGAGEVMDTFSSGATLTADNMNNIKNAVNNNNSRISSLESTSNDTLSNLSCSDDQVAKFNGSSWTCASDEDSDTTYSAGEGVSISNTEISVDTSSIQKRVQEDCGAGYAIRRINEDGTVVCEFDSIATYTPGPGVSIIDRNIRIAGNIINVIQTDDQDITDSYEEVISVTFTTPANGYVHVQATGRTRCHNNPPPKLPSEVNNLQCETYAAISQVTNIFAADKPNRAYTFYENLDDDRVISIPFATQAVYEVKQGTNTIYLLARHDSHVLVDTSIRDSQMVITYHPTKM